MEEPDARRLFNAGKLCTVRIIVFSSVRTSMGKGKGEVYNRECIRGLVHGRIGVLGCGLYILLSLSFFCGEGEEDGTPPPLSFALAIVLCEPSAFRFAVAVWFGSCLRQATFERGNPSLSRGKLGF